MDLSLIHIYTVARALLSIYEEYAQTEEWDSIYQKVCDKVLISGNGQDFTFEDFIKDKYPDLVLAFGNCGYAGYSAAVNAQADAVHTLSLIHIWYQKALYGVTAAFGVLTVAFAAVGIMKSRKAKKQA